MIINRLNYEVFLVDYLDGKLNPSLVDDLLLFLDQNPDIKNDLDGILDAVLVSENTVFPNKSILKKKSFHKDGIDNEFEYLCIASAEGVITQEEAVSLQNILDKDYLKRNQFQTFQKLKIASDPSIRYSNKQRIKRTPIIPIRHSNLRLSISVAASIAIVIGVYSIGRIMVNNNPLENFSNSNVALSYTPSTEKTTAIKKNAIESKEPKKGNPTNRIIEKGNPIKKEETKALIDIEESIPNLIHRIDFKNIPAAEIPKEELAQFAAQYAPKNQLLLDQLYAQQENQIRDTKEFGAFEAIQYGVRSLGKLLGRDIKLDANKDDKGKIEKIVFESKLVAFSAQVNNNQ